MISSAQLIIEPRVHRATNLSIRSFDELSRVYSKNIENFFFIQVGANDGRIGDPLYHLVTEFHWRGVLVEPQKPIFERLVANYAGSNNLYFENVAIDKADGQRELFRFSFSNKRWATGLASFHKSHLERHIENGYVERMIGEERDQLPANKMHYIKSELVATMSFDTLISKYEITHIDLLQIDTEGYDYHLLQLYDFDRLLPAIIQFEHHVMTEEQRTSSLDLLHDHDYLTFTEGVNIVGFRRNLVDKLGLSFDED